jgi:hypothetical protein
VQHLVTVCDPPANRAGKMNERGKTRHFFRVLTEEREPIL